MKSIGKAPFLQAYRLVRETGCTGKLLVIDLICLQTFTTNSPNVWDPFKPLVVQPKQSLQWFWYSSCFVTNFGFLSFFSQGKFSRSHGSFDCFWVLCKHFPFIILFSLNIEGQSQTVHLTADCLLFPSLVVKSRPLLFWAPHFKQRRKINVCSSKEIQVVCPKHQNILVVAAAVVLLVVTYIFVSLVTFQNTKVKWPSVRLFGPTVRNTCISATCAHFWKQVLAFLIFIFSLIEKYHTVTVLISGQST